MRIKMDLRNCDCMDLMKEFPDKYFELAIVDPPYGIGVNQVNCVSKRKDGRIDKRMKWDEQIPTKEYFAELCRVSKNQIIWGANYFNCFNGKMGAIIWNKMQPLPDSSQCEIASCSIYQKVAMYEQRWTNFVNTKQSSHPTEKPVALYKWLLQNYANQGDKILDTHLGSMSSVIACYDEKFDITGAELDPDYFKAGMERVNKHTSQVRLDDII